MLSVSLGPLALPVGLLVWASALAIAVALARRAAGAALAARAENMVWLGAGVGWAASRLAFLAQHPGPYLENPLAAIDLRDGGWWAPAGVGAALGVLAWKALPVPELRRAAALAAGCAALALAVSFALGRAPAAASTDALAEMPLIEHPTGQPARLGALLDGRPMVVNLWASWCGPCRAEMPMLGVAQQREPGVRFLFVNQGESGAQVQAYLQRDGLALRDVWLDASSALGPAVGSRGLPTTLFFDARGRRVDAHFGVLNAAALQARLDVLRER